MREVCLASRREIKTRVLSRPGKDASENGLVRLKLFPEWIGPGFEVASRCHSNQPVAVLDGQGLQDQTVAEGKNRGIDAHAERERPNDRACEGPVAPYGTDGSSEVHQEIGEPRHAVYVAAPLHAPQR